MPTPGFNLSLIVIMTTLFSRSLSIKACRIGWFGTDCNYKCWCVSNMCDGDGVCLSGIACVTGWFGPSCQYNNLMATARSSTSEVHDGDIDTCTLGTPPITVNFNDSYQFSWLRIVFNGTTLDPKVPLQLDISFKDVSTKTDICAQKMIFIVDASTADIHCNMNKRITQITISGLYMYLICELFVNGGRNIALKQQTTLSSVLTAEGFSYGSDLAVDGSRDGYFQNKSCSSSLSESANQKWSLRFPTSVIIYRAVLINQDVLQEQLQNFTLKTFDVNGKLVQNYRDPGIINSVYRVQFTMLKPVSEVTLEVTSLLTLCEFEAYGEIICPRLKWGLDCLDDCHCETNQLCSLVTGKCDAGCQPGFYGPQCKTTCPQNCLNKLCFKDTGACAGCQQKGYAGDYCDIECLPDEYGKDCDSTCSSDCKKESCDNGTKIGDGIDCSGRVCDQEGVCKACSDITHYGLNCSLECPPNCIFDLCNRQDGTCTYICEKGFYGKNCSIVCSERCKDKCDIKSGFCFACKSTFYGYKCEFKCPLTCPERACDIRGNCLKRCPKESFGPTCSIKCPKTCHNESCFVKNGSCMQGCKTGFFGANCSDSCPSRCNNSICDVSNGSCYACDFGHYGLQCDFLCSEDCSSQACDFHSGACSKREDADDHTDIILPIAVVVVLSLLTTALCWKYSRYNRAEEQRKEVITNFSRDRLMIERSIMINIINQQLNPISDVNQDKDPEEDQENDGLPVSKKHAPDKEKHLRPKTIRKDYNY